VEVHVARVDASVDAALVHPYAKTSSESDQAYGERLRRMLMERHNMEAMLSETRRELDLEFVCKRLLELVIGTGTSWTVEGHAVEDIAVRTGSTPSEVRACMHQASLAGRLNLCCGYLQAHLVAQFWTPILGSDLQRLRQALTWLTRRDQPWVPERVLEKIALSLLAMPMGVYQRTMHQLVDASFVIRLGALVRNADSRALDREVASELMKPFMRPAEETAAGEAVHVSANGTHQLPIVEVKAWASVLPETCRKLLRSGSSWSAVQHWLEDGQVYALCQRALLMARKALDVPVGAVIMEPSSAALLGQNRHSGEGASQYNTELPWHALVGLI